MARLRLFAGARAAAGTARDEVPGLTVAQVLDGAVRRYGPQFQEVLSVSRIWVNGEPAADEDAVADGDEVAVLPPVSGGATPLVAEGDPAPVPAPPDPVVVTEDQAGAAMTTADQPEAVVMTDGQPGAAVVPDDQAGAVVVPEDPAGAVVMTEGSAALAPEPVVPDPEPASRPLRPAPPAVPHGRLGVIWGVLTAAAVLGGRWSLALWLALGAVVAILALARSRGLKPVAVGGAALAALVAPLLAAVSWWAALGALVAGAGADVLVRHLRGASLALSDPPNIVTAAGAVVGLAASSLVVLDRRSLTLLGVLLALVCLHDASRYLVGWGAPSVWEGRGAGIAAVGSATLALAVLDPSPLRGAYPWLMGALVVAAGAFGTTVVRRAEGEEAVGPLRRMDTLVLAAPAVLLTAAVAHLG
ncbi:MAG TPA: MoaD/ThiS family protein [Acidimicrobiales bacterium]|nr:MoaD/ThiS family protein [Acidimicrobiales bacterium]